MFNVIQKGCIKAFSRLTFAAFASTLIGMSSAQTSNVLRLFMSGDVMLGRGVDQILAHHVDPKIYEDYVKDARDYVELAVDANGPLPDIRNTSYVWGDAINVFEEMKPDVRMVNLETAVTAGGEPWPYKGINYRMHPNNVPVLRSAGIQCCILSNNHVIDWGYDGLNDTLNALRAEGIKTVGAGADATEAEHPAIFDLHEKHARVLVFGAGSPTAGVIGSWRATASKGGVHYVDETSASFNEEIGYLGRLVKKHKTEPGDVVIFSLHWGDNWGWVLQRNQQEFARRLIDEAHVDIVYGHSSHHIKGVEIYKNKLIAYGCGDLISDYEGIKGGQELRGFRDDLSFLYFVDIDASTGHVVGVNLTPMRLKHMQIKRAVGDDEKWLFDNMKRECHRFGGQLERNVDNATFTLKW